jgi:4-amino-4-deoxy-L-arabinose transferase-like glycosyltransferase
MQFFQASEPPQDDPATKGAGSPPRPRRLFWFGLIFVLATGIWLRLPAVLFERPEAPLAALRVLHPNPGFTGVGFDENLYRGYINSVIERGLTGYPDIVDQYIEVQKTLTGSILPPMRFLYIGTSYFWHLLFGTEALQAAHNVASFFSILALLLATFFAWRLKGPQFSLAVAALMAFAPTQLHMSQHALVDGFFAFWALLALWLLWENLRAPSNWRWLLPYLFVLALMVITKENAAFAGFAFAVLIGLSRWLKFGTVTKELLACTVIGPLLGFVILVFLAGGLETLRTTYTLSVSKNYHLTYAIMTGDGPWHRYLVDILLVSPIVLLLALGSIFRLNFTKKPELFLTVFMAASYLIMCNLKYGMNLRYANMWDMPLRLLAFAQLAAIVAPLTRYRTTILVAAVALLCAFEYRMYLLLFVENPLYELVTEGLLRALKILKNPGEP